MANLFKVTYETLSPLSGESPVWDDAQTELMPEAESVSAFNRLRAMARRTPQGVRAVKIFESNLPVPVAPIFTDVTAVYLPPSVSPGRQT